LTNSRQLLVEFGLSFALELIFSLFLEDELAVCRDDGGSKLGVGLLFRFFLFYKSVA